MAVQWNCIHIALLLICTCLNGIDLGNGRTLNLELLFSCKDPNLSYNRCASEDLKWMIRETKVSVADLILHPHNS